MSGRVGRFHKRFLKEADVVEDGSCSDKFLVLNIPSNNEYGTSFLYHIPMGDGADSEYSRTKKALEGD